MTQYHPAPSTGWLTTPTDQIDCSYTRFIVFQEVMVLSNRIVLLVLTFFLTLYIRRLNLHFFFFLFFSDLEKSSTGSYSNRSFHKSKTFAPEKIFFTFFIFGFFFISICILVYFINCCLCIWLSNLGGQTNSTVNCVLQTNVIQI